MSENLRELLLNELREAVAARIAEGDPEEVTAELTRRLRRIRQMQEDHARLGPPPRSGRTCRPVVCQAPDG